MTSSASQPPRDQVVCVRFPPDELLLIDAVACYLGITRSAFLARSVVAKTEQIAGDMPPTTAG